MKNSLAILTAAFACMFCPQAHASIAASIQPTTVSAAPGATGASFDVVLSNTGPSSISVQSFSFQVTVADTDITLTGADFPAANYIFAGNSFDIANSFALNTDSPGQTMNGSDGTNDGTGITVASGESFNLGEILFDVSPTAAIGTFAVSFSGGTDGNNLSNPAGGGITINTFTGGDIMITSLPEPSTLMLMLGGGAALLAGLRIRALHTRLRPTSL